MGGREIAADGRVERGGAEVLPEVDDGGAGVVRVEEGAADFVVRLAEAEHQARLDDEARRRGGAEDGEGARVVRLGPHGGVEARHRFKIVAEDVGLGGEDGRKGRVFALEVGYENLDPCGGGGGADGADNGRPVRGPAVGEVVARHGGDDDLVQPAGAHRLGHAARFVGVGRHGGLLRDVAEAAVARALGAENEDGGMAAPPAVAEVRAGGGDADGVEP